MATDAHLFVVRDEVAVRAPIERCFALSTNLAVVEATLAMRPVGGRLSGAVVGGDTVRWRGWKWGLPHVHESLIDAFDPPVFFRDRMIAGRFAAFQHDHFFTDRSAVYIWALASRGFAAERADEGGAKRPSSGAAA